MELSMTDVLARIANGIAALQTTPGTEFQGGIVMLLEGPVEWVELIESACTIEGVELTMVEEEEAQ